MHALLRSQKLPIWSRADSEQISSEARRTKFILAKRFLLLTFVNKGALKCDLFYGSLKRYMCMYACVCVCVYVCVCVFVCVTECAYV